MKTKIKVISIIVLVIMVLGTIDVQASKSIKLSLNDIEEVNAGENITLKIKGSNIPEQESKVAGIKVDLFYDTEVFEFISARKLDAASNTFDLYENYPEEGRIRIGFVSMIGLNKNGELYEVTLKSKEDVAKSELEIRLEAKEVVDFEDNDIPTETENSTIKFKNIEEEKAEEGQVEKETNLSEEKQNEIVSDESEKEKNKNIKISNDKSTPIEITAENKNDTKNNYNIIYFIIIAIVIIVVTLIIIKKILNKKNNF